MIPKISIDRTEVNLQTRPIGKIIYTTNAVEEFHRQVCKVTQTKGAFTNDISLLKLVYLATKNIEKNG